jgi:hypothetical protein
MKTHGRKGFLIMSGAPQPAQPRKSQQPSGDFESFIDGAFRDHVVGTAGLPPLGELEPRQLLRYAAGKATDDERTMLEDLVNRSRWAYERVVTLVRSKRPTAGKLPNALARRLLDGNGKALSIVGQAILEVEGVNAKSLEEAWKKLEKEGTGKTRAACLIGLGRHEEARKLIDEGRDPVWTLLRRVSAAALETKGEGDEDEAALLALLDVLPSL